MVVVQWKVKNREGKGGERGKGGEGTVGPISFHVSVSAV